MMRFVYAAICVHGIFIDKQQPFSIAQINVMYSMGGQSGAVGHHLSASGLPQWQS